MPKRMKDTPRISPLEGDLGRDRIPVFIGIGVSTARDLSRHPQGESLCPEARSSTAGQCLGLRADVPWWWIGIGCGPNCELHRIGAALGHSNFLITVRYRSQGNYFSLYFFNN